MNRNEKMTGANAKNPYGSYIFPPEMSKEITLLQIDGNLEIKIKRGLYG
jgi:hypothetical protein